MGSSPKSQPLLAVSSAAATKGWLGRAIDLEEAKIQILLALPMIITNVTYYLIPLASVMFAGHLGELELAGSNLANSWASVSGFTFMIGLSGALETLCGQGFGAKLYRMLGIYLQASCIISIIFAIILSIFWWFSDTILISLHQDPQIATQAGLYLRYLIPGLFAYGLLQNILRFLQAQSVVIPLLICSLVSLVLYIGIAYILVDFTTLGYCGAPLAVSITLWISVLLLGTYVIKADKLGRTWDGLSFESLQYVFRNLKLAIPSAAMVCLEYWAFEGLVILAGLMPNPEISTSLVAMCVNAEFVAYMFAIGLSATASTRVSNALGSGNTDEAKQSMKVILKLTVLVTLTIILVLSLGYNLWARSFSNSPVIIHAFATMTPLLAVSIFCDCVQGVLTGVARGCGWQHMVVFLNLGSFYSTGMPIACILGFKLQMYAKGLWIGLICGLSVQMTGTLLLSRLTKWSRIQQLTLENSQDIVEPASNRSTMKAEAIQP